MRPLKLIAFLVFGLAGCPDLNSLSSGLRDLAETPPDDGPTPPTGRSWMQVYTSPSIPLNAISGAQVSGASPTITAVGNSQTVVRGDGTTFMAAAIPGAATDLQALWVNGAMEVWVAGTGGQAWRTVNGAANWVDMISGTAVTLRGIFGRSPTDLVAAGDDTNYLRHWNGVGWAGIFHDRGEYLLGVWASPQRFWIVAQGGDSAVTANGGVNFYNVTDVNNNPRLNAVSGSDDANVFTVTESGRLYRYNSPSTQWDFVAAASGALRAMWVKSATEIWVAGVENNNGTVFRCTVGMSTCTNLSPMVLNQYTVTGIWGNAAGTLWVSANSGNNGAIFKY